MKDQFVSYDLALKLKELGFDEPCLTKYGISSLRLYTDYKSCSNKDDIVLSGDFVSAPLWQQAFDWFRVEHGYYGDIYRNSTKYLFSIEDMNIGSSRDSIDTSMGYEEARQACLEKLIEIIKQ